MNWFIHYNTSDDTWEKNPEWIDSMNCYLFSRQSTDGCIWFVGDKPSHHLRYYDIVTKRISEPINFPRGGDWDHLIDTFLTILESDGIVYILMGKHQHSSPSIIVCYSPCDGQWWITQGQFHSPIFTMKNNSIGTLLI